MARLEAKAAAPKNATAASSGDDQLMRTMSTDDEDELFELDIALLNSRDSCVGDDHHTCRGRSAAVADGDGHALLANCLLPVSSVSNAVPVTASSIVSSYPYFGYYSSRRLFTTTTTTTSSKRFLGRPGNSARFCFSIRGFETMGNYFQRY
ncbi:uncharacterized protein LOC133906612 [Phragmites australis]|uniref:uncharacterized protein LOC133906612 n=1 Tax=Phragmites australis TaxID=29695 RepID=UPI002D78BE47|nr:uncharacterized protein LOC133906612 [Phragmites australis]